ncbi:MAG: hypothetical protein HZA59_09615 [Hydrogenophilales bacterium]|nr:hypothetical protein [Hydrogenophilales bacterium]
MANDAKKLSYWQQHFTRWESSGLSRRAYCAREGLALSTFDYWRRQTRANADQPSNAALTLVPVQVERRPDHTTLRSPAGWELTLPVSVELADLAGLLKQLP